MSINFSGPRGGLGSDAGTWSKAGPRVQLRTLGARCAFTLIELLTVISIIGVIAALVVGVGPAASRIMKMKKIQGELNAYVAAIDAYKARYGHYPLDNRDLNTQQNVNSGTNQLYYELVGSERVGATTSYTVPANQTPVASSVIQSYFRTPGFENSKDNPNYKNFLPNLKPSECALFPPGPSVPVSQKVVLLNTGLPRIDGLDKSNPGLPNPWHYVSTNPTHNPDSFDLWAEVMIGNTPRIIGNWKQ